MKYYNIVTILSRPPLPSHNFLVFSAHAPGGQLPRSGREKKESRLKESRFPAAHQTLNTPDTHRFYSQSEGVCKFCGENFFIFVIYDAVNKKTYFLGRMKKKSASGLFQSVITQKLKIQWAMVSLERFQCHISLNLR